MSDGFAWATVTAVGPLRVKLDGDTTALPFTPDSLLDPLLLAVGNRVRCELMDNRIIIHGFVGGSLYSQAQVNALITHRNKITNGAFQINQRGYVSGAALASGGYAHDRWKASTASTSYTFTQAPQGQLVTLASGKGLQQVIERADMPAGAYVLSWGGTATGRVYNVGGSAPSYAASPVLVTVDGLADVLVEFTAPGGAQTVGLVQLEPGSVATPFEREPIMSVLSRCQRYFWQNTVPDAGGYYFQGFWANTSLVDLTIPVTLRATPIVSFSNLAADSTAGSSGVSAVNSVGASPCAVLIRFTMSAASGVTNAPAWFRRSTSGSVGWLALSAEL